MIIIVGLMGVARTIEKDFLVKTINQFLSGDEAGIIGGVVLGDKTGFSKLFYNELRKSGLLHIMVASGSNVMLLGSVVIGGLAAFLGRKKTIIISLLMVWGYVSLVGWEMPVIRAALMISIFYYAQLLGRMFNLWRALIMTVGLMIIAEPLVIGEVGFWMSVTAYIGVVTKNNLWSVNGEIKILNIIKDNLITTLWVNIWLLPIFGMVFARVSVISLISNILVLWMIPLITIGGGVGIVMGLIHWMSGSVIFLGLRPFLWFLIEVVSWMGTSKWAEVGIRFNWWMVVGWYLILFWIIMRKPKKAV